MKYYIDTKCYRIKPDEKYIRVNGWAFSKKGEELIYHAQVNGEERELQVKKIKRSDVKQKHKRYDVDERCGFHIRVNIGEQEEVDSVVFFATAGGSRKVLLSLNKRDLEGIKNEKIISHRIDGIAIDKNKITVHGWAFGHVKGEPIQYHVYDSDNNIIESKITLRKRKDVYEQGYTKQENPNCGFTIVFNYDMQSRYQLCISTAEEKEFIGLEPEVLKKQHKFEARKGFIRQSIKHMKMKNLRKIFSYIRKHGFKGLKSYIVDRVNATRMLYGEWFELQKLTEEELEQQREKVFGYSPVISLIVPTYNTPIQFLDEMIDSVRGQTYGKWELCLGDGSEGNAELEAAIKAWASKDSRIKYKILSKNLGISGNTNGALEIATGDYIGLLDHDDALAPNALYEVVKALQEKAYDILYTDEDKVSADLKEHADPNFKPDFSMDLFCSHNYITHFFVVKHSIMKEIGGFRSEFDGSQDYDLMFRCIERAESIKHIPQILYYWRIHGDSVAGDPASKMYAYDAGKRAIEEHFQRIGVKAAVEHTGLWGMYHVLYDTSENPLISIVIPNKDHITDLDLCISSITKKSAYKNIEFIIVENNSEEQATFDYYKKLPETYENVKVVYWEDEFNYSAINNYGVQHASGEYLLFLNNDTELINETGISELLGVCMREDVGAVGAKLLYPDDTVQHAGIVVGFGGYAGHVFHGIDKEDYGFMVRARINCNYSAVTAACMMTKTALFHEVGGFDTQFKVACNDVDYCLKVRAADKLVTFNAFSQWYHYESKSRGYEDTVEKMKRFENEVAKFQKKWPDILEQGDPFYNPNFPITHAPFTLG